MFCPNCGNQVPDNSFFCPSCGANLQISNSYEPPVNLQEQSEYSFAKVLRRALCSGKFLAMCILVTAATVLSFAPANVVIGETGVSSSSSIDIWAILTTIAMWMTYANARNSAPVMAAGGLKFNAVLAKITFVVNWIAAGIIFVCGVVLCALGPMFSTLVEDEAAMEEFYAEITSVFEQYNLTEFLEMLTGDFLSTFIIIIGIFMLVLGVVFVLLNVFYYGKVSKFANNLHISYITNKVTDLRFSTISIWLMVMGIWGVLGSLSSIVMNPAIAIASISSAAAMIVASVWVKALGEAVAYIPQPVDTAEMM